jgi:uncharacterized membrane protein YsdA (DUF1294 family)
VKCAGRQGGEAAARITSLTRAPLVVAEDQRRGAPPHVLHVPALIGGGGGVRQAGAACGHAAAAVATQQQWQIVDSLMHCDGLWEAVWLQGEQGAAAM